MKALITGISGQDGSYLAELLIAKGYEVHGIKRRASSFNTQRIDHLHDAGAIRLHYGDLTDATNLIRIVQEVVPDEIYNLGAQSHVAVSFDEPEYTAQADALGALRLLEAIRILGLTKTTKFYQASSSEMFGDAPSPQSEATPFRPRSPYAAAKAFAYWTTVNYREAYGIHASNGILFNHESPRRGETFVSRKITRGFAGMTSLDSEPLRLGNLDARRDWGHARDYVEAMWLMLQQPAPSDLVIATGESHSVREFVEEAYRSLTGDDIHWDGVGLAETGRRRAGRKVVVVDPAYFRPTEVPDLRGDARKAAQTIGWRPKTTFAELVREMMAADLASEDRRHVA